MVVVVLIKFGKATGPLSKEGAKARCRVEFEYRYTKYITNGLKRFDEVGQGRRLDRKRSGSSADNYCPRYRGQKWALRELRRGAGNTPPPRAGTLSLSSGFFALRSG